MQNKQDKEKIKETTDKNKHGEYIKHFTDHKPWKYLKKLLLSAFICKFFESVS